MVPQVACAGYGACEGDPAQRAHENVGPGGNPEPELIGTHGGRWRGFGEEVALDAVRHIAARAVNVLVEGLRQRA
jgi:hypothetical protein